MTAISKAKDKLQINASNQFGLALQQEQAGNRRDNRYIRGSSIGFCRRRLGYGVLGYQPLTIESHSLFTLKLGNAIHDMFQTLLVNMGWIKAEPFWNSTKGILDWRQTDDPDSGCELDVEDHTNRVIGHLDGITVPLKRIPGESGLAAYAVAEADDPTAERYLIEIKSISDRTNLWVLGIRDGGQYRLREEDKPAEFIEIDAEVQASGSKQQRISRYQHDREVVGKNGVRRFPVYKLRIGGVDELVTVTMTGNTAGAFTAIEHPKPEHIAQASFYADHYGIEKILFVYIGKDVNPRGYSEDDLLNFPVKVFEHRVDPFDIGMLKQKVAEIYQETDQGKLPERDYLTSEDKECVFCPYRNQCWPNVPFDIQEHNSRLIKLGLPPWRSGPGVAHTPKADLTEDFAAERPE